METYRTILDAKLYATATQNRTIFRKSSKCIGLMIDVSRATTSIIIIMLYLAQSPLLGCLPSPII
uniref:Uncharacterized protein n=1 Tax=Romanomermis culicivorax TaxID=13658 RepID=A0A915KK56_ROMCU